MNTRNMIRSVLVGAFMLMEGVASAQETTAGGAGLTVVPAGFGSITIRENQRRFEGSATLRVVDGMRLTARVSAPLDAESRQAALGRPAGGLVSGFNADVEFAYDQTAVAVTERERQIVNGICPLAIPQRQRRAAREVTAKIEAILADPGVPGSSRSVLETIRERFAAFTENPNDSRTLTRLDEGTLPTPGNTLQGVGSEALDQLREAVERVRSGRAGICDPTDPNALSDAISASSGGADTSGQILRQSIARRVSLGLATGLSGTNVAVGLTLAGSYDRYDVHIGGVPTPTPMGTLPSTRNLDSWRFQVGGVWRLYIGERNMLSFRAGVSASETANPLSAQVCVPINPMANVAYASRCSEVKYVNAAPEMRFAGFARVAFAHLFGRVIDGALPGFEVRAATESFGPDSGAHFVVGASVFMMPAINTTFTRFGFGADLTVPFTGDDRSATVVPYAFVGVTP